MNASQQKRLKKLMFELIRRYQTQQNKQIKFKTFTFICLSHKAGDINVPNAFSYRYMELDLVRLNICEEWQYQVSKAEINQFLTLMEEEVANKK